MARPPVPLDKVNEMFIAYVENPSTAYVANKCGVSQGTAKKYIVEGHPSRGIVSFKDRLRRVTKMSQRTVEETIACSQGAAHASLWEHHADLDVILSEAAAHLKAQLRQPGSGTTKVGMGEVLRFAKAVLCSAEIARNLTDRIAQVRRLTETTTTTTTQPSPDPTIPQPTDQQLSQFTPQELDAYLESEGQVVPDWLSGAPSTSPAQHSPAALPAPAATTAPVGSSPPSLEHTAAPVGSRHPPPTPPPAQPAAQQQPHTGPQHPTQPGPQPQPPPDPHQPAPAAAPADTPAQAEPGTVTASGPRGERPPVPATVGAEDSTQDQDPDLDFPTWGPGSDDGAGAH